MGDDEDLVIFESIYDSLTFNRTSRRYSSTAERNSLRLVPNAPALETLKNSETFTHGKWTVRFALKGESGYYLIDHEQGSSLMAHFDDEDARQHALITVRAALNI